MPNHGTHTKKKNQGDGRKDESDINSVVRSPFPFVLCQLTSSKNIAIKL